MIKVRLFLFVVTVVVLVVRIHVMSKIRASQPEVLNNGQPTSIPIFLMMDATNAFSPDAFTVSWRRLKRMLVAVLETISRLRRGPGSNHL